MASRKSSVSRKTNETDIKIDFNMDGTGVTTIDTANVLGV